MKIKFYTCEVIEIDDKFTDIVKECAKRWCWANNEMLVSALDFDKVCELREAIMNAPDGQTTRWVNTEDDKIIMKI